MEVVLFVFVEKVTIAVFADLRTLLLAWKILRRAGGSVKSLTRERVGVSLEREVSFG